MILEIPYVPKALVAEQYKRLNEPAYLFNVIKSVHEENPELKLLLYFCTAFTKDKEFNIRAAVLTYDLLRQSGELPRIVTKSSDEVELVLNAEKSVKETLDDLLIINPMLHQFITLASEMTWDGVGAKNLCCAVYNALLSQVNTNISQYNFLERCAQTKTSNILSSRQNF